MAKKKQIKKEEKAILEIIEKYGEIINLKKSPYLIAEIIREYLSVFSPVSEGESGPVPGSHGTPPPPGPHGIFDFERKLNEVIQEVSKLSSRLNQVETKVNKLNK
jgi:hypothetical protein